MRSPARSRGMTGAGAAWLAAALAALVAAEAPACPRGCVCVDGLDFEITCPLSNNMVTIVFQPGQYLKVECERSAVVEFSEVEALRNVSLPTVSFTRCGAGAGGYAAALRRLGARPEPVRALRLLEADAAARPGALPALRDLRLALAAHARSPPELLADLASLPALVSLKISGAVRLLDSFAFAASPALLTLELSEGELPTIPDGAFQKLTALERLSLWGNGVSNVTARSFEGLSSLEELDLSSNSLRELPAGAFSGTPALTRVALFANALTTLPGGLFAGLERLEAVLLFDNAEELALAPRQFADLPRLASLRLDRCGLRALPADALRGSPALLNLSLADNALTALPPKLLVDQIRLRRLDLSGNRIEAFTSEHFVTLGHLEDLDLDGNLIEEFPERAFSGLKSLVRLSARGVGLTRLADSALRGADGLRTLLLSRNELTLRDSSSDLATFTSSDADYFNFEFGPQSPFAHLQHLHHLDLAHNRITTIFADWCNSLLTLRLLDLSDNHLRRLTFSDVNFLSDNVTVDLRHNELTVLDLATAAELGAALEPAAETGPPRVRLLLDDNPYDCDCALYPLVRTLRRPRTTPSLRLEAEGARCATPPALRGSALAALEPRRLTCPLAAPACPPACACTARPADGTLSARCADAASWRAVPAPRAVGLRRAEVALAAAAAPLGRFRLDPAELPAGPVAVDLSRRNITEFRLSAAPATLESVDLGFNDISRLDEATASLLLNGTRRLNLAGNPLACDCDAAPTVSLLRERSAQVEDFDELRCAGADRRRVRDATAATLCGGRARAGAAAAAAGAALAALLLALALGALCRRYGRALRPLLYACGCRLPCLVGSDDEDDGDVKLYDAFVSYSHADEEFVLGELVPALEAEPHGFRLCLHFRDWVVGDWIPAQIARSVERSRRTLLVLSERFAGSAWGAVEFRAAAERGRLVVVVLGDVRPAALDAELAAYLAANTYVKWGDPWFWEKLLYAMPRRRRGRARPAAEAAPVAARLGFADRLPLRPPALAALLTADGKLVNAAAVRKPA